uniref:ZnMc domain-containing protein n=1 Tax=Rhabditophanes sp. KR3021 TaxID=114890 RepID=A0AC35TPQ8_9BILA
MVVGWLSLFLYIDGVPVRQQDPNQLQLDQVQPFLNAKKDYDVEVALKYLREYGYLHKKHPTAKEFVYGLEKFQDFMGIPITGIVDSQTISKMHVSRCGNVDIFRKSERVKVQRVKRFFPISKWENKVVDENLHLTWFISTYTEDMKKQDIKRIVAQSFRIWQTQYKLKPLADGFVLSFAEAGDEKSADIVIKWAEDDHGDDNKFDGPGNSVGNILAHTFFPTYNINSGINGDIHLDDYEFWVPDTSKSRGKGDAGLLQVLTHEIGHSLGIGHSRNPKAIMFSSYVRVSYDNIKITFDDKCALYWTYVGESSLCMQIWLLNDVQPFVTNPNVQELVSTSSENYVTNELSEQSSEEEGGLVSMSQNYIKRLRNVKVPLCTMSKKVRHHFVHILQKQLHMSHEKAVSYSRVICAFYAGLHKTYKTDVITNLDHFKVHYQLRDVIISPTFQESRGSNIGEDIFGDSGDSSIYSADHYDSAYFDNIFKQIQDSENDNTVTI